MKRILLAAALVSTLLAGCASKTPARSDYYSEAAALTKLTAAVESTVRYKSPPEQLGDRELLELSTRHDPVLLENLSPYRIRVQRGQGHAVVLLCTPQGRGLIEDAGCTKEADRHHWKADAPCDFTLSIEEVCAQ